MISASGVPNTLFLPSDQNDLCDRIKLLLRKVQGGNNSNMIYEENYYNTNAYLRKNIRKFYLNVIYYTQRKNNYKYSNSRYTRISSITHINVCIHKYNHSYNCIYTQI